MRHKREKKPVARIFAAFRQIFRRRTIIVACDQNIDQYALGGKVQAALLLLLIGGFCWISFSTGSYMAAQSVMEQKDRQLVSTTRKTQQIGEEYSLLRRDLQKLQDNKGELGEYAKFVLAQHSVEQEFAMPELLTVTPEGEQEVSVSGEAHERLMARVNYLENRVAKLQKENQQIVVAVRERTRGKIKELTEAIKLAGFNVERMKNHARRTLPKEELMTTEDLRHQGGPFVPLQMGREMDNNMDQMMLLDSIVRRLPLGIPMNSAKITSGFGRRIDPFRRRWAMHTGIDFSGGNGAPVTATNDGIVKHAGWEGAYGQQVEVSHGLGLSSRYAHLSRVIVRPGQRVKEGDVIGLQGSTGRSTGNHLHYEVFFNGNALNPANFLRAGRVMASR